MYILIIGSALLVLVVRYLINYYKWWQNVYRHIEKIPGPRRYPIVGTMYPFLGVPQTELMETYIRAVMSNPSFCRSWNGNNPEVNISTPEHMELIMRSSTHINKDRPYHILLPWLGEGLLTAKGDKWQLHRKLITPTFHFNILENFMEVFVEKSKILLEQLDLKSEEEFFDIRIDITKCTLDIICETAMGVSVCAMSNKQNDFVESIYKIVDLFVWRFLRPYVDWDPIFYVTPQGRQFSKVIKALHNFSKKVIADRKKLRREKKHLSKPANNQVIFGKKPRLSFLDILLDASEEQNLLSDSDIREEVDTFIFEGHDTTTSAITWCLFLLGNYPEVQERVYEEIKTIVKDNSTPTTLSQLNNLKYLECVIKEALRLYPSVPLITRSLTEDIEIDEYKVPMGTLTNLHIYICHRNPKHFPDPEKFDPDRFLPENSKTRHPYAYIPFSAGPRNCIGQKFAMYEEKTILSSIIKKYKITSRDRLEDIKLWPGIILKPQNGINLKLNKRL